jgi:hypothetical protein
MFSLDKFYSILHDNLISKLCINNQTQYFYPFGTYDNVGIVSNKFNYTQFRPADANMWLQKSKTIYCYFLDQEPIDKNTPIISGSLEFPKPSQWSGPRMHTTTIAPGPGNLIIFATSEKSDLKNQLLKSKEYKCYDWYYFFHGFAALNWFRDLNYVEPSLLEDFDKVFISYNNLISNLRSYRLHLVSNLLENNLMQYGLVSLRLEDDLSTWKDVIGDPHVPLDKRAKLKIVKQISKLSEPLVIDTNTPHGSLSADIDIPSATRALWHVVTETIYFLPKLHLTEKTFKPIAVKRPFILVAAPGNLAYLKSYGFKTFDRWIDESYDEEQDHYIRIEKITAEIKRLCELSPRGLKSMYEEMKPVLEYNYNHFFGDFKKIIVNEMIDNFEGVLMQFNNGRQPNNHSRYHHRFDFPEGYLAEVKQRLLK